MTAVRLVTEHLSAVLVQCWSVFIVSTAARRLKHPEQPRTDYNSRPIRREQANPERVINGHLKHPVVTNERASWLQNHLLKSKPRLLQTES